MHVIVNVDGMPIEIQIRTELQDLWAQIFERLGDVWGRAIRYGGEPDGIPGDPSVFAARRNIVALLIEVSADIADLENDHMTFEVWPVNQDQPKMDEVDRRLQDLVEAQRKRVSALLEFEAKLKTLLAVVGEAIEEEVRRA